MLKIEPIYDGNSTEITQYKVVDETTIMIWATGTLEECEDYVKKWNNQF